MHSTIDFSLILTMSSLHFLALISPGPDFFLTLRNALSFGPKVGIGTAFGFGAGILLHLSYCIAGVASLLVRMTWFPYVKYVAGAYLIWIGVSSLLSLKDIDSSATKIAKETGIKTIRRGFLDGFITNIFNPKASLFLLGLFTTVVTPQSSKLSLYIAGMIIVFITILWFVFVSLVFGNSTIRHYYFKAEKTMTVIFSIFFIVIAVLFCLK